MMMELGLMVEPQLGGTYDDLLALAQWADQAGLDSFARSDHYLHNDTNAHATDALISLAGLARETKQIKLTTLVSPLTFRNPAVMAKSAATIDEMSGGRMELGVGTGWMASEHDSFGLELPDLSERFSRLYETLAYLHAAFGRKDGGFSGRHYHLDDMDVLPRPTGKLPIIIGGSGMKKTPTFAGKFADEYNMFVTDDETLTERRQVMQQAAINAGRSPGDIKISFVGPAFVGDTEKEGLEKLAEHAVSHGQDPEQLETSMRGKHVPIGSRDQAFATMQELTDLGVGRYYCQVFKPLADIDFVNLDTVFSALRG
ncbi:MAG: LLM class flavin-dependent oxidoreductase [Actinobacteria bacterium]|nr:LLM class flavin-dependent oxidoreductase [Actinomycetota bacterium]